MLNVDPVVKVNINIAAASAARGTFDVGAIIGNSAVLDTSTRFAAYANLAAMETAGFSTSSAEYKAAEKYFGVSPAPAQVVIIFYDPTLATPETPAGALADAIDKGAQFYGVYYCPGASEEAASIKTKILAIESALVAMDRGVQFYGVTGTVSSVTSSGTLLSDLHSSGKRSCGLYCTTNVDDAAGLMGLAMGLSRTHYSGAFALCYKTAASVTVNNISETDVTSIKALNGNVCVSRTINHNTIEAGAVCSGLRFDEVLYIDRIAYELQSGIYNLIAESDIKLPQNDSTSTLFVNTIVTVLEAYYNMGVLATGTWRGVSIGGINTGDVVEHGYNVSVDTFDNQSVADRAARKAMPITILLLLSGAVESIVLNLNIQT